jgi:hypothetical protein
MWGVLLVLLAASFASSPVRGSFWNPDVLISHLVDIGFVLGLLMIFTGIAWGGIKRVGRISKKH